LKNNNFTTLDLSELIFLKNRCDLSVTITSVPLSDLLVATV